MKSLVLTGSASVLLAGLACSNAAPAPKDSGGGGASGKSSAGAPSGAVGGSPSSGGANPGAGGASAGSSSVAGRAAGAGSPGTGGAGGGGGANAGGSAGAPAGSGGTTGGAAGAPASGAGTSAGGSVALGGGAGTGASGTAGNAGGGTAGTSGFSCASVPLCDDFETGSVPNATTWTTIPAGATGASIDTIGAHGSGHSLKVVSSDRLYLRNSAVIGTLGSVAYVHFYVRFSTTLASGHGAMVVTHPTAVDQYTQSNELRFGSQDMVFHWNTDADAANVPDVSPDGDATSFKPAANTWYCVNLVINTGGNLNVSIDGTDQPGLTVDGTPTMNIDQAWLGSAASLMRYTALADFNVGWDSYGAGAMTMWYDDVALSTMPLPCP
jgi:hypothetical protein